MPTLKSLQGRTYAGKSAHYRVDGQRVLNGGFLKVHMIDVASPPQYEAIGKLSGWYSPFPTRNARSAILSYGNRRLPPSPLLMESQLYDSTWKTTGSITLTRSAQH
jgi:hypothetical protein